MTLVILKNISFKIQDYRSWILLLKIEIVSKSPLKTYSKNALKKYFILFDVDWYNSRERYSFKKSKLIDLKVSL